MHIDKRNLHNLLQQLKRSQSEVKLATDDAETTFRSGLFHAFVQILSFFLATG